MRSIPGSTRFIRKGKRLFTLFGEDREPRTWDPFHSKLAAFILKGGKLDLDGISNIIYLGGGHGTTISHMSDLLPGSCFYVVEFGPSMGDILELAESRENIYPIMEDARRPENYAWILNGIQIDMLYQDIAQKDQVGVLRQNLNILRPGGSFMFMLKVRSISQEREGKDVAGDVKKELDRMPEIIVHGSRSLSPYQRDHVVFWGEKK